jgi:hypothetical protein
LDNPEVMLIQGTLLAAVQNAVDGLAVTATEPTPPDAEKLADAGLNPNVALADACVTVRVSPAIKMDPDRGVPPLLAATEYFTVPLPLPEAPLDTLIQLALAAAVHGQPVWVVTLTE